MGIPSITESWTLFWLYFVWNLKHSPSLDKFGRQYFFPWKNSLSHYPTPLICFPLWQNFSKVHCSLLKPLHFKLLPPLLSKNQGYPGGSVGKESAYDAGDLGSVPEWGRFPGEGNSNPHQYFCLGSPRDRGTWWATVHGVAKSQARLSDYHT